MDITEIRKNKTEVIKVTMDEYQGHIFAALRIWTREGQKLIPSKKGITLPPRLIGEVIAALERASDQLGD